MTLFKTASVFVTIYASFIVVVTICAAQAVPAPAQEAAVPTVAASKAKHRASLILIDERPYGASAAASPEMSLAACLKAKKNFQTLAGKHTQRYTCLDLETGDLTR